MTSADTPAEPLLRVVRGVPTDVELAALTAVIAARAAAGGPAPSPPRRSTWSAATRTRRALPPAGPGAWRDSARPR